MLPRRSKRRARFVCPACGVGDHLYRRAEQRCAYCPTGKVLPTGKLPLAIWRYRRLRFLTDWPRVKTLRCVLRMHQESSNWSDGRQGT